MIEEQEQWRFWGWLQKTLLKLSNFGLRVVKSEIFRIALEVAEEIVPILIQANAKFPVPGSGAQKLAWATPEVEQVAAQKNTPTTWITRVAHLAIELALAANKNL